MMSRVFRQSAGYAGATVVATAIGAVTTILLANHFSVREYATYSFACSVLGLLAGFFEFGLLAPAIRHLPTASSRDRSDLIGTAIVTMASLAAAYGLTVFGISFVINDFSSVDAAGLLRITAAVSGAWVLMQGCLMLAQGAGKIGSYRMPRCSLNRHTWPWSASLLVWVWV